MTKYKQLGQEQRYVIGRLLKTGRTQQEIATAVGCHKSTISRELKRNIPKRGICAKLYRPDKAEQKTVLRHKLKPKCFSFIAAMRKQTVKWLTVEKLSPELITAKGRQELGNFVSHETIYKWIWEAKHSHRKEHQPYKLMHQELKHGRRCN